jgi:GNAT superfamily N-acetyltransferase
MDTDEMLAGDVSSTASATIAYAIEPTLGSDEFIDVLVRSTLAERRPVGDRKRIARMLRHGNLIVTARDRARGNLLVGVSRCLTDFAFCCYCSDLAVDVAYQSRGIGRALLEKSRDAAGPQATFLLLAAPKALGYYAHIGMPLLDCAYAWPRRE